MLTKEARREFPRMKDVGPCGSKGIEDDAEVILC